ncbi:MAG TPA: hypothetical protein VH639_03795 [Bryobacteraceae bacterium]|jgi:hypothetical protein
MILRSALLLLPLAALAQTPAPEAPREVDQALRARVTEFFQDLVDAKFVDALDLVAADTKNDYFASAKTPVKEFRIRDVKYASGFEKAAVTLDVKRLWKFSISAGQDTEAVADVPMTTTWKLEKGKWVWSNETQSDAWVTPMGASDVPLLKKNPDGTISGMPSKLTQDVVDAAARKILQQTGLDKSEVTLATDKPSSERVVFHNGAQGSIRLELHAPQFPGLNVKVDKTDVNFGEDAALQISYDPPAGGGPAPESTSVYFVVIPFDQPYQIKVNFAAPK